MKKSKNFSKRTFALLIAAALLLVSGTVTGARAAFIAQSDLYKAQLYVNHLEVHLYENGKDVCDKSGALATSLGYKKDGDTETLGAVDPGKAYAETIQAMNSKDVDQYVRITIRKYWLNEDGTKATDLSPSLIHLTYGKKQIDDNTGNSCNDKWVLGEWSTESATYYYNTKLGAGKLSEPLFDTLKIDKAVIPDMHMPTDSEIVDPNGPYADYVTIETKDDGKTKVYTYSYKYDGYTFYIEADVQALQTHNAQDAIHSAWGVYNVKVNTDGSLSVQ